MHAVHHLVSLPFFATRYLSWLNLPQNSLCIFKNPGHVKKFSHIHTYIREKKMYISFHQEKKEEGKRMIPFGTSPLSPFFPRRNRMCFEWVFFQTIDLFVKEMSDYFERKSCFTLLSNHIPTSLSNLSWRESGTNRCKWQVDDNATCFHQTELSTELSLSPSLHWP